MPLLASTFGIVCRKALASAEPSVARRRRSRGRTASCSDGKLSIQCARSSQGYLEPLVEQAAQLGPPPAVQVELGHLVLRQRFPQQQACLLPVTPDCAFGDA